MSFLSAPLRLVAVLLLASLPWGCDVPEFQGPQIQSPPPAFTMNASTYQDRRMFPERDIVFHDAWVEASWGNFSGIYINGHAGRLGREEVETARAAAIRAATGSLADFGEVESLQVDGRTAWGWGESWRLDNGGLQYVVFRAAIPYDTITYAVDFLTGDPGLKSRPDSLRTIVASFAVGRTTLDLPLIAIVAGVALLLLNMLRSRNRARVEATRRMTLIQMPPKEEGGARPGMAAAPKGVAGGDSVAGAIARRLEERDRETEPGD